MDLYSIMCVSDRTKALQWYGVFFGRAADEVIGGEHLWQVGENAWVVVDDRDVRAERVGGAMITLGVAGLRRHPGPPRRARHWPRTGGDLRQRCAPRRRV